MATNVALTRADQFRALHHTEERLRLVNVCPRCTSSSR